MPAVVSERAPTCERGMKLTDGSGDAEPSAHCVLATHMPFVLQGRRKEKQSSVACGAHVCHICIAGRSAHKRGRVLTQVSTPWLHFLQDECFWTSPFRTLIGFHAAQAEARTVKKSKHLEQRAPCASFEITPRLSTKRERKRAYILRSL